MGLNGVSADVCVEHMCGARSWANGLSCAYGYIFNNLNDIPWSSASVSLSLSLTHTHTHTHTHTADKKESRDWKWRMFTGKHSGQHLIWTHCSWQDTNDV